MRSPLPFPCVPDRPYKILLVQVGTLSFSHPSFGVSVYLFIIYGKRPTADGRRHTAYRPEQRRMEGSPLSRGRHDHCPASEPGGLIRAGVRAAPLRPARRRAAAR